MKKAFNLDKNTLLKEIDNLIDKLSSKFGILAKCVESIPEKLHENEKQNFETLGYTLLARGENQSL